MNSISCFIVDDQSSIDLLSTFIANTSKLRLAGSALSPESALNLFLSTQFPDVLFLNIDLYDKLDLNVYEFIIKSKTLVIETSAFKEHAFQAFEEGVFDYLLKPFSYQRFLKTINKLNFHNIYSGRPIEDRDCFYVQAETKGKIIKVVYDEIKFIEANQNYVNIFIDNGKHVTYQTMKVIEQKLPPHKFIRVHKSFIVNETRIYSVNHDCVILKDKTVIKIGPNYRESLLNRLI